jgi:aminomethyltransferase
MLLRTPLNDWHRAHQARMVDFGGWDMPVQYTSITAEHVAVRTRAGLFDISHMGRLTFSGPDALDLIQLLFTNDAASMKRGQVRYGLICNEQGGVLDDVLVYRLEPFWLMVVNASNRDKILAWIRSHQGRRSVQVTDRTPDWSMIAIQGPRAVDLMNALSISPTEKPESWPANLRYYHATQGAFTPGVVSASMPAPLPLVSRTGYTGEDGFEVIVPASEVVSLGDRLCELAASGQAGEPFSLTLCGLGARDTLRLEAGMPLYGHELSEEIDPYQAGLGWAVKLDKGDFLGRQALLACKDKPRRKRVGLQLAGRRAAREGATVLGEGQPIGVVTSGTFTPTLNAALAMAYVDPAHGDTGTSCAVDIRGKREPARVVDLPFYRRSAHG